ncbi:hypothetical protein FRB90_001575 [Tulasnella sp. 427]|nr:hypothetical protein FRB90_001575 [Tulasnella sp. 427]
MSAIMQAISREHTERRLSNFTQYDKNPNDETAAQKFQELAEAYEVLVDPDARAAYDDFGTDGPGGMDGVDPDDIFAELFGGMRFGPGGPMPGGPGGRKRGPRKGESSTIPYEVTLEDLYNGKEAHFNIEKGVVCGVCKGFGGKPNTKPKPCAKCEGKGITVIQRSVGRGQVGLSQVICPDCSGEGLKFKDKDRCKKCKGEKTVKEKKKVDIYIEKGMADKQKIVLHGEGDQEPDVEPGDLIFVLNQEKHPNFERAGSDLMTTVHITLSEALLGFSRIIITHLDGRGIHVDSEQGRILKTGDIVAVRGEGMPTYKHSDQKGDLYIRFEVDMPSEDWLRGLDSLEQLLPPKKPDVSPRPEIVDEVAYEKADIEDFGTNDENSEHWTDDDGSEGDGPNMESIVSGRLLNRLHAMLPRLIEVLYCASLAVAAKPSRDILHIGGQGINLWKLQERINPTEWQNPPKLAVQLGIDDSQASRSLPLEKKYPASYFEQHIDHNDTTIGTFKQRYWVDDRFYESGGPVFVLDGGETSGADRLPFLDHGILAILSNATGGLSIVLEHRYYGELLRRRHAPTATKSIHLVEKGESSPVDKFTTDSLRWLTNEQALEDSAQFMRNFTYNGVDLSATNTPWIYYGGSYAGARAAHMRVLYPDLVFGAIASSAVTHAAIDYSDYFEVIRRTNNQTCVEHIVSAVATIDRILDIPLMSNPLKALFGLQGLKHDDDFGSVLVEPLGAVQAQNWDPSQSTDSWARFCETVSSGGAGTQIGLVKIPAEVVNYANWIRKEVVSLCPDDMTVEDCFGTYDDSKFRDDTTPSSWKAWTFQVCNTWGYFMPAPADPERPSLLSRRITLEEGCTIGTKTDLKKGGRNRALSGKSTERKSPL